MEGGICENDDGKGLMGHSSDNLKSLDDMDESSRVKKRITSHDVNAHSYLW